MRSILISLALLVVTTTSYAQNGQVERSLFGIQTGFLGLWAHNEARLSRLIALRAELGLDGGIWGGDFYEKNGFLLAPVITLEPKWYYNLAKRAARSKRTDGNSGNFISLKTSYHPDWFLISNYDNIRIVGDISFVPTWGIRRNLGNHFNYEAGLGVGYVYYFAKRAGYVANEDDVTVNFHLRIGYRF